MSDLHHTLASALDAASTLAATPEKELVAVVGEILEDPAFKSQLGRLRLLADALKDTPSRVVFDMANGVLSNAEHMTGQVRARAEFLAQA